MQLLMLIANFIVLLCSASSVEQPNILFVLADDLGWYDVGWRNPDILTPNFDNYARSGVILNNNYVQPMCSPSRAALLTGLYPLRTGMSHSVIFSFAANGLPTRYTLLPQKLQELGYSTHIIGKWHLGYCNEDYLPQSRGFDTSFYIAPSSLDYYSHQSPGINASCLFNDQDVITDRVGTYINELFVNEFNNVLKNRSDSKPFFIYFSPNSPHSPLQAPEKFLDLYSGITNEARKNYSAMVSALDEMFGQIVQLLKDKGEYENTIIIFTSDNGGQVRSGGCNYPLRGAKTTLYEGGTRASAFVHSPLLPNYGYVYDGIIHITDWFATVFYLAGGKSDNNSSHIDGVNVWDAIISNSTSPRKEFVYNIDDYNSTYGAAIRVGRYKLIVGNAGLPNTVVTVDEVSGQLANGTGELGDIIDEPGSPYYRLFDLNDDPNEETNLAKRLPWVVLEMNIKLERYLNESLKSVYQKHSPNGYPSNFGGKCGLNWCEAIVSPDQDLDQCRYTLGTSCTYS